MSLRKVLVRFVVVTAPFVFCSLARQTRAQSQDENANATAPLYKAVSIKPSQSGIQANGGVKLGPDELTATNASPQVIIEHAYEVHDDQIVGAPSWLNSKRFDIEAKANNPAAGEDGGRLLESGLLSKYFKLAVHRETRLIPVYELVIAGDGPKLRESDSSHDDSSLRVIQVENGRIMGREVPIATLARILSEELGLPVLDKTQLPYHYDVTLQWPPAPDSSEPTILTAIHTQLGLKLVPTQLMFKDPIPGYELVIAEDGPKLQESSPAFADSAPPDIHIESGQIMGRQVPMSILAKILSQQLGRPVLDKTQLSSHYDLTLQWLTGVPDSSRPTVLTAIQDQLGLKLVPQLMPKEFLVIDHVEMPVAD